jgi:hypothetical protein
MAVSLHRETGERAASPADPSSGHGEARRSS